MIRDPGPVYNLGFGVPVERGGSDPAVNSGDPNAGPIARALGDNPLLRFAVTSVATVAAFSVAGKISKSAGFKILEGAQDLANKPGWLGERIKSGAVHVQDLRRTLDELEGVTRYVDGEDPYDATKFVFKDADGKWKREQVTPFDGPSFRAVAGGDDPWRVRDELQRRLVRSARRLPYELPGAYIIDKAINDPLLGNDTKRDVNWSNPFDVVGDFAWESTKNVAFGMLPFDLASASGAQGYRKFAKSFNAPGGGQDHNIGVLTTKVLLEELGIKSGEILNKSIRFSHQSMGAFSQAVEAAAKERRSMVDVAKEAYNTGSFNTLASRTAGAARRKHMRASMRDQDSVFNSALNAMPGPFKGMNAGLKRFRQSFTEHGETYDAYQDILSGRRDWSNFDANMQSRVRSHAARGGGTHIEQVANQLQKMGIGGVRNSDDVASLLTNADRTLNNAVREEHYKDILVQNLQDVAGLSVDDATRIVTHSSKIAVPYSKQGSAKFDLADRFQLGKRPSQATNESDWWQDTLAQAGHHKIGLNATTLDSFKTAIQLTDRKFLSHADQAIINRKTAQQYAAIKDGIIPEHVGASIASRRMEYNELKQNLAFNDNYLVRNTAHTMGIKTFDSKGSPLELDVLRQAIAKRGIDAEDKTRLLGYLVEKKVVKAPWQRQGRSNMFGFTQLSMQDAVEGGYFSHRSEGVQAQIRDIVEGRTKRMTGIATSSDIPVVGQSMDALRMKGVYRTASGNIIDVGRMKRSFMGAMDALATETKIPILNFNPMQLGFWGAYKSTREANPIQFASKYSLQNVAQRGGQVPDFYMFLRSEGRAKGKLFGMQTGDFGEALTPHQYAGEYKPFLTNRESMTGRYSELFLGRSSSPSSKTQTGWKKLFNVATDQEGKLVGKDSLLSRMIDSARGKSQANRSGRRAARTIGSKDFNPSQLNDKHLLEGVEDLSNELRGWGGGGKQLRYLDNAGIFKTPFTEDIDDISVDTIASVLANDRNIPLSKESKASLQRAQQRITGLFKQSDSQVNFWDLAAPPNVKTSGVSNRMDQLRSEFAEYLALRSHYLEDGSGSSFGTKIVDSINELDRLHKRGVISSVEKAESRASLLSLQLQYSRNKVYDSSVKTAGALNKATVEDALSGPEQIRSLFSSYGSFDTSKKGLVGRLGAAAKSRFGPAQYDGPPLIDAIGANYTFIPTVATGMASAPLKTLKGLFGGSWSDAESITSGSLYSTHLAARINKYFEGAGIALDMHQYKGPMDFYMRGVIGKRVLPAVAGGAAFMAVDRTAGGMVYKDDEGNRVYRPLVLGGVGRGIVEGQSILAGAIPGGMSYSEKKEQMLEGEVAIRQGRWWLLNSNTPFRGGRIEYFRPSWYRRLTAGADYAPEMNNTPMEQLFYGYDFSPGRYMDPYHYENQDKFTRPYPVSGDFFTGPWGPLTSVLNSTVGSVIKPTRSMHPAGTAAALSSYMPVGQGGAIAGTDINQSINGINATYAALAGSPGTSSAAVFAGALGVGTPGGPASVASRGTSQNVASMYSSMAGGGGSYAGVYGPLVAGGLGAPGLSSIGGQVVPSTAVQRSSQRNIRAGRFGFETQEMAGIYGFGFGATRATLGLGSQDFTPNSAILESSTRGYSSARSFWNLNLGGMGDFPLPIEGRYGSLEVSEVVRRFVPKDQQGIQYINGLPNMMGQQYPWLPGSESSVNVKHGDPYGPDLPDAVIRLPGTGRDRAKGRVGRGNYSMAEIHDILGDIDPFGEKYRMLDKSVDSFANTAMDRAMIAQTRAQQQAVGVRNEFTPYKYRDMSNMEMAAEASAHPFRFSMQKGWETLAHHNSFINNKFLRVRTAQEDWERSNIYGATYPNWNDPVQSFLEPVVDKATQRNMIGASLSTAFLGSMFGVSTRAKTMGSVIGGAVGFSASVYGSAYEKITGRRFMPSERRKEVALEEQTDILEYMHSMVNASRALESGDQTAASEWLRRSTMTMYGANLNASPEQLSMAIPNRKREHFRAMMYAPESEREGILSTAGRLERRMLQAAWGQKVEKLPDLGEYFSERELPAPDSSFWSPYTDMEAIQIKMGQNLGLDMSQMGYYPQQIQEANLINPVYPEVFRGSSVQSARQRLNELLLNMGVNGQVSARPNPFSNGDQYRLSIGQ